uniref:Uncharacterized protein n=1 Tax=Brassica oleracea var. oleracea TaxID=109376 RepID=A0A0D3E0L1_BRAOL
MNGSIFTHNVRSLILNSSILYFSYYSKLLEFTEKLEAACVGTVESGKMTKDLALIIHGAKLSRDTYLNTEEFIDAVADDLQTRLRRRNNLLNSCI